MAKGPVDSRGIPKDHPNAQSEQRTPSNVGTDAINAQITTYYNGDASTSYYDDTDPTNNYSQQIKSNGGVYTVNSGNSTNNRGPGQHQEHAGTSGKSSNAQTENNSGTHSKTTVGDNPGPNSGNKGCEVRENNYCGIGGKNICAGSNMEGTVLNNRNNHHQSISGNVRKRTKGNESRSVEGDLSHHTGKSRYDTIGGEYGIHLPSGNMDVQLDSGKARISTAQEILLICGSSYVKILPNRIEIVADRIDLNP
tara:strand:- start:26 stop:781 length:756 start_codon:yes stop_codon:yes gene_type:complete